MKIRKASWLILAVSLVCAAFGLASCGEHATQGGGNGETHTLTFYVDGADAQTVSAAEGEDISSRLPKLEDTADWYFGGWYSSEEYTGEAVTLPTQMPSSDASYYARQYAKFNVERQVQKTDLSTYEKKDSISGEIVKGKPEPTALTQFLAQDVEGFKLHTEAGETPSRVLPSTGKDRSLTLKFDRKSFTLTYEANVPEGVSVSGSMPEETVYYGVEHALAENAFSVNGYRFTGWSLTQDGETVTHVTPTSSVTVYAVWETPYTDYFNGSDLLYIRESAGEAILVRGGEEYKGTYNAATSVFSFTREEGTLDGKLLPDRQFFYIKSLWQTVLHGADGSTLELKKDGTAVLTIQVSAVVGSVTQNGVWTIDPSSGYFMFITEAGRSPFIIEDVEGTLSYTMSSAEQGWYALKTEEGYGYDLLYLDGFGRMSVYAVSPNDPAFDPFFDVYSGTYEKDTDDVYIANYGAGMYSSTFPFKLTKNGGLDPLDGVTLAGTYIFGDWRGEFTDIDNESSTVYLDGFGKGEYNGHPGSYTIESDSWLVDNYPEPGRYSEDYVLFTLDDFDGEQHYLTIADTVFIEHTADFSGRYAFEIPPLSIYPGSSGETAFMYFSGYTIYVEEGSFNDASIWFGNMTPKYATVYDQKDLPLYDWRDDGAVFPVEGKENTYRYESTRESVSFEFEITQDKKIRWRVIEEEAVFYNEGGEKIYVGTDGVGYYQTSGTPEQVQYGMNSFLASDTLLTESEEDYHYLVLVSFHIHGEYRSFTYEAPITQTGFSGTLTQLKEVKFVANVGTVGMLIVYKDDTAVAGLDLSIMGGTGYWFVFQGSAGHPEGETDAYTFTASGSAPEGETDDETEVYQQLFDRFANLRFKLGGGEEGIYDCLEYDGVSYDITCASGTLKTDGYGTAHFTPTGGREYICTYGMEEDVLYLTYEEGEDLLDWYIIPSKNNFVYASDEAGVFFTYDENGEVSSENMVILNGDSFASGYYEGIWFEGTYEESDGGYEQSGITFRAFEITVTNQEGEEGDVPGKLHVLTALVPAEEGEDVQVHVGIVYFRVDASVGNYYIVDANGTEEGTLQSDGYMGATLTYLGETYFGELYRGNSSATAQTNEAGEREFAVSVTGKTILFLGEGGEEFFFDFEEDSEENIILRQYEYGTFFGYTNGAATEDVLVLDGHGKATLTTSEGAKTYSYEPFSEAEGGWRLFGEDGKTVFVFSLAVINNEEEDPSAEYGFLYVYRLFAEGTDGTYIKADWTMCILDGFGNASYVDEYGVLTRYEAILVEAKTNTVLLRSYNGEAPNKMVSLGDGTFEEVALEFIVSDDGVLLAYYGEGGDIALPDTVKRIAEGVFDGVEITHVNFNKVEVIEANVFEGQSLDGVDAPFLRVIGERAFARNTSYNFEEINLPKVEEIGEAAFIGCSYLEHVTLGGAVTSIGAQAFAGTGSSYADLIIDMKAVEDPAAVTMGNDILLAVNAETVRILLKDIAAVNAAVKAWPSGAKVAAYLSLWSDGSSEQYLVSLTEGAVFELYEGIITKAFAGEEGELIKQTAALYEMKKDMIAVYAKQADGAYAVTAEETDTSSPYALTFGGCVAFNGGYEEYHIFTVTGDQFNGATASLAFTVSSSSGTDYVSSYTVSLSINEYSNDFTLTQDEMHVPISEGQFDIATGKLTFVSENVRYALQATSATECTITSLGGQKTVASSDGEFRLTLLVDEDGAAISVVGFEVKNGYSYDKETILSSEVKGNEITISYEAGVNLTDTLKFTLDGDTLTYVVLQHVYSASNLDLGEGYYGRYCDITLVFGDDCKITEVKSFAVGEGYGGEKTPETVNATYEADGSAILTLADGTKVKVVVTHEYSYAVEVAIIS